MIPVGHKILGAKIRELFLNEAIILKNEITRERPHCFYLLLYLYSMFKLAKMLLFVSFVKCSFR